MQEKVQKKIQQLKKQMALKKSQKTTNLDRFKLSGRKISKQNLMTLIAAFILVMAHIAILLAVLWSWRYYSIYPSLFGSAVALVLCVLAIIDIIFFIGFNHKDLALKIISSVMAALLLIGGTIGSVALSKANTIVNNVLDDGKSDKYETFSGAFVYYKGNKNADNFKTLNDLSGKKVGMLVETTNGLSYIATNLLSKEKIDYATVDYKTNAEMVQGLLDGDVDAIVITSAYRSIYKGVEKTPGEETTEIVEEEVVDTTTEETETTEEDSTETVASTTEESPFAKYLPDMVDFYTFEQELKMDVQRSTKNLSTDPFNVLLIGYSRVALGSSVGLADSIILATINPQTYEVSMTSIARDSFVPVACYGGEYDKINSGRSTSRACFIETVENFLNMDIDYYMELDYLGLVQIVNVIGGVYIDNPVDFTLDGIYVPAGHILADGQMALQFCRERHHMPGGDFDRQQHQKEVIIAIAQKFIESGSVTLALKAMEEASEWMSTDMTLSQLTSVFNLLLNTKNFTSLETFDLVDFQNTRITGNGGLMYYSYPMRLPLWVYLIYKGSYEETLTHINNVMGKYKTINQTKNHLFSLSEEYIRPRLYSLNYENKYVYTPDPMPAFWASLTDMSLSDAIAWANANGVSLSVNYIKPGDSGYDESLQGLVVSQSPRYGSLISEYSSGSIEVMAMKEVDPSKQVPDFVDHNYQKAREWAREYGIRISIDFDPDVEGNVGDVVSQDPKPYTDIDRVERLRIVVKAGKQRISFDPNGHGSAPSSITIITGDDPISFPSMSSVTESNGDVYEFIGWFTSKEGGTRVYYSDEVSGDATVFAQWEKYCNHDWRIDSDPTCTSDGKKHCDKCKKSEDIPALGHNYETGSDSATCTEGGKIKYTCTRCGDSYEEDTAPLGHEWVDNGDGTSRCERCGETKTNE